jgi:23S rRNA U2552 (ribose-2'-O)-methylase RlmE/FtsJ
VEAHPDSGMNADPDDDAVKFVFRFAGAVGIDARSCSSSPETDDEKERASLVAANDRLHAALNTCKNHIARYYQNKKWDQLKKFTNEYELVFTSSSEFPGLSSYQPISRSFFKLWEILHDCGDEMFGAQPSTPTPTPTPMRAAFLAEGPGGFIEAFCRFRNGGADVHIRGTTSGAASGATSGAASGATSGAASGAPAGDLSGAPSGAPPSDTLYGMTLLSHHRNVPAWKVPRAVMQLAQVTLHAGADGTGDLYNLANIDTLVASCGAGCDLVTADGGFDFSGDFNAQEAACLRLLVAEVYAALRLQRAGASFVLKIYDIHATGTIQLLHLLYSCYRAVRLVKPLTSRPANSEKYLLCTGFEPVWLAPATLPRLRLCVATGSMAPLRAPPVPCAFLRDVVSFNLCYIARQISYIARTLVFIRAVLAAEARRAPAAAYVAAGVPTRSPVSSLSAPGPVVGAYACGMRRQLDSSLRWCHKYGVRASMPALRKYQACLSNVPAVPPATVATAATTDTADTADAGSTVPLPDELLLEAAAHLRTVSDGNAVGALEGGRR